jgi:acetamidase/formamidase
MHPENGGNMVLQNFGILPQHYTSSQLRKMRLESIRIFSDAAKMTETERKSVVVGCFVAR